MSDADAATRRIFDALGDAVVVVARADRVAYANPAATRLLGWSAADLVGRPVGHVIAEESWAADPLAEAHPVIARLADGTAVEVEIVVTATDWDGEPAKVGVLRLPRHVMPEPSDALPARLLPILAQATAMDDGAPALVRALAETLGWDVAALWVVDRSIGQLRCRALWHPDDMAVDRFVAASRRWRFGPGNGFPGRVWKQGHASWVADIAADAPLARSADAAADGLASAFGFPVTSGSRFIGVVELWSCRPREPDPELLAAMAPIGSGLGQVLERWQSEAEQAVLQDRLGFLAAASQVLAGSLDLDETLTALARLIVPRLADWCAVHVVDAAGEPQQVAVAHVDASRVELVRQLQERYPPDLEADAGVSAVVRTGQPVFFGAITDDMLVAAAVDDVHLDMVRSLDLHAVLIVPLTAHGRRLGALSLATETGREISDADRSLAEELASRAAQAVDNARLYRETRATGEALRMQTALLSTQAEAGMEGMMVVSPNGQMLSFNRRFAEMWGLSDDVMASRSDEEALARAMQQVIDPEGFMARIKELYAKPDRPSREEVAFVDGRVFDRYGAPLRDEDGTYLGWAWYFRDISERKRTERQLVQSGERFASLARTLQQSLLPPDLPDLPGIELAARYRPAGSGLEVGGDFYDVFRIGRGTWGLVMGDVCGKGAEAASLTALARYTVRAAAMQTNAPALVLGTLNEAMFREAARSEEFGDERFATVVYGVLRRTRHQVLVTLACGGHAPPLVMRADGSVAPVGTPGTLLGLFRSVALESTVVELHPGDALVLFTDGVTEAPGAGGQFGEDRLTSLLAACAGKDAGDIAACIEATVIDHQGGRSRDDMAVLVVRVPPD